MKERTREEIEYALAQEASEAFAQACDNLLSIGVPPAAISFGLASAMAILNKMGGIELDGAISLAAQVIRDIYAGDDVALARKAQKEGN